MENARSLDLKMIPINSNSISSVGIERQLMPCIQFFPYRVLSIHVGANGSESTFFRIRNLGEALIKWASSFLGTFRTLN